jgi:hypothetical protein
MVKWMTVVFGAVPVLGWLASMPWNYLGFGTPFTGHGEWNNLPLWLATAPCLQLCEAISRCAPLFREHPYATVLLYTLVCTVLYALTGYAIGCLATGSVRAWKRWRKAA